MGTHTREPGPGGPLVLSRRRFGRLCAQRIDRLERSPATDSLHLAYSVALRTVDDAGEVELRRRVFTIGGSTTLVRGNTYCLETRVAVPSDSPPAEDVTITLSELPQGAIRLDERFCDSFGATRTAPAA